MLALIDMTAWHWLSATLIVLWLLVLVLVIGLCRDAKRGDEAQS